MHNSVPKVLKFHFYSFSIILLIICLKCQILYYGILLLYSQNRLVVLHHLAFCILPIFIEIVYCQVLAVMMNPFQIKKKNKLDETAVNNPTATVDYEPNHCSMSCMRTQILYYLLFFYPSTCYHYAQFYYYLNLFHSCFENIIRYSIKYRKYR